jgi:hypothetical protein
MITQLGLGTHPIRLDLVMRAGQPFHHFVVVEDGNGVALNQSSWTAEARVLSSQGGSTLATLTLVRETTGLALSATSGETTAWATTWPLYSPWWLRSVHPLGDPVFSAAGWISLYR